MSSISVNCQNCNEIIFHFFREKNKTKISNIFFSTFRLFCVEAILRLSVGQSLQNCCCYRRTFAFSFFFRPFCRFMDVSKKKRERGESPSPSLFQFFTIANPSHTHTLARILFWRVLERVKSVHGKFPPPSPSLSLSLTLTSRLKGRKNLSPFLLSHFHSFNTQTSVLSQNMHTLTNTHTLSHQF